MSLYTSSDSPMRIRSDQFLHSYEGTSLILTSRMPPSPLRLTERFKCRKQSYTGLRFGFSTIHVECPAVDVGIYQRGSRVVFVSLSIPSLIILDASPSQTVVASLKLLHFLCYKVVSIDVKVIKAGKPQSGKGCHYLNRHVVEPTL